VGQFWTPIDTEAVQLSDGHVALSFRAAARAAFSCGRRSKASKPFPSPPQRTREPPQSPLLARTELAYGVGHAEPRTALPRRGHADVGDERSGVVWLYALRLAITNLDTWTTLF
jgi:hypothetical protein